MKINNWTCDRLRDLGINEADAKELRGLGVRLQLLEETLLRETREAAEASADETPLTNNERRFQQLMNRVRQIIDRYANLSLTDGEDGGIALYKDDELLLALETAASGDPKALEKVLAIEITW